MDGYTPDGFAQARVLHYHDALWPAFHGRFLEMCKTGQPALYEFLKDRGPLSNEAPLLYRVAGKFVRNKRTKQQSAFEATCEQY
jgi:hypothetical protein